MKHKQKFLSGVRCHISWRTNLWLIPGILVASALFLFTVAQTIDRAQFNGLIQLPRWLNQGGASDCLALVAATAGAIITTLGLVLSITVLIFSTAATQFGQRLLRRYMRDRGTQVCIGIFSATFVFALLTLVSITARPGESEYVPWVSAEISVALALSCVGVLIYFIHHVAVAIQVNTVLTEIAGDLTRTLGELTSKSEISVAPVIFEPQFTLQASASGYLQWIDYHILANAARDTGTIVKLVHRPGRYVLEGSVIATGMFEPAYNAHYEAPARLARIFQRAVNIGPRRTIRQDPEFAIAQFVEIGLRAMSPAVNDPFTMLSCLDYLSAGFVELTRIRSYSFSHCDSDGRLRVMERRVSFARMVAAGLDPIRQVAHDSVAVTIRIFHTISAIVPSLKTAAQVEELKAQADLTREGFDRKVASRDIEDIDRAYAEAKHALAAFTQANVEAP
ncbi:MAG: DUF2254 domain-containing protein [Candidatus Korobacteraceae bacterium]